MRFCDLSLVKKCCLAFCLGMIFQHSSFGQCAGNMATRSYDTSLATSSFGMFNLSFPKWSPDSGLLVSVKLTAEVSSQYGFTLRNADAQPATYQLTVGQMDQFMSDQLPFPFTNLTTQVIGSYPLDPGQSVTKAPFAFLDKHISSDSITAVAPFLGTGADRVNINYTSFTYTNLSTYNNATYYYGATISNTIKFSIQYLYCKAPGLLATNLTLWTARLQDSRRVDLDWSAVNEVAGRKYTVQRSSDGKQFTGIASLPAVANDELQDYTWSDQLADGSSGSYYYRLLIDDNGSLSYSAIRQVTLATGNLGLRVYPNPAADFINLAPGEGGATGDWQVDILSANGSLIQRETYLQASTMRVTFRTRLSAGTYFIRALDLRGQKRFTSSFIVVGRN